MTKSTSTFNTAQIEALETFAATNENGKITNEQVAVLAKDETFKGKTVPAIRGKVVAMKLYKAGTATAKPTGEAVIRKADFVTKIETLLSVNEGSLSSFEKASKTQLQIIVEAIEALNG